MTVQSLRAVPISGTARRFRATRQGASDVVPLAVAVSAGAAGYLAIERPGLAVALLALPALPWVMTRRVGAAVLLGLVLPWTGDVTGRALGLEIAPSDLVLTGLVVAAAARWLLTGSAPELADLRPIRWLLGCYLAALVVLLVAHPGVTTLVGTAQRIELVVFPLLVGALLARQGKTAWLLGAYLVSSTATATLWIAGIEIGQKNPVGQFIANAVILLIACPDLRRRFLLAAPVLVVGLLWTQSRGAILSVVVALVVLLLAQRGRALGRTVLLLIPVGLLAYGAFQVIPDEAKERNLSYSSGTGSRAEWSIRYRELQHQEAWALIHAHPGLGVGVGGYLDGDGMLKPSTSDPHHVLLYEWAQGGYLLLGGFLVLMLTPLVIAAGARGAPLANAAAAMTAALMGHGLVDIYWARGTPVLGWLLVGMALAQHATASKQVAKKVSLG